MSGLVYPTLPGITFDSVRSAIFNTGLQASLSGKESRIAYQIYPLFQFDLTYELLRDYTTPSDLRALMGLFVACRGRFDTFLYSDPVYHTVTLNQFGTGDGATAAFQITATYQNAGGPGGPELVQNFNGTPQVFVNGVATSNYTLGATGIATFAAAPALGAVLSWTGSFFYRCRFDDDTFGATQFMNKFWSTKKLTLKQIKL